jgi:hypothetical protein
MKPGDALRPDVSLDMWYCLSNNASMFKMFEYNLHPAKKQQRLLNEDFEGYL